jgi:hypothetical protein
MSNSALDIYQAMPAATWENVSLNTISDVDPCPANNCSYSAVEGQAAVLDDWNGMVLLNKFGNMGGFIAFGGGHNGYFGNELYVFDVELRTWVRYTEPYPTTGSDDNQTTGEFPDGSPLSRHTYDYVQAHEGSNSFVSLGSASNHEVGGGGSTYVQAFNFSTNAWRRLGQSASFSNFLSMTGASSAYDTVRDVFWVQSSYEAGLWKFDPNGNDGAGVWTEHASASYELDCTMAYCPLHDCIVIIEGYNKARVSAYDCADPNTARVILTQTGTSGVYGADNRSGIEWHGKTGKFYCWHGRSGDKNIYTLTPPAADQNWRTGTWTWAIESLSGSNTVTPSDANATGTYTKWRYAPKIDRFLLVNRTTGNTHAYRPGATYLTPEQDWVNRSTGSGVILADRIADAQVVADRKIGSADAYVTFDTEHAASGNGCIKMEIPSNSGATSSDVRWNFADDGSVRYGENSEFYVQWRQRFSPEFLSNIYDVLSGNGGWKMLNISEGDYPGRGTWDYPNDLFPTFGEASSLQPLEIVVVNSGQRAMPLAYHSSLAFDRFQEPYNGDFKLQNGIDAGSDVTPASSRHVLWSVEPTEVNQIRAGSPAFGFVANEWMTFQCRVKSGPLGTASDIFGGPYGGFTQGEFEMWAARDGQPSVRIHNYTGMVWKRGQGATDNPSTPEDFGKIWFTPFHTSKDPAQSHPVAYTWYDELIISNNRIPDPQVAGDR